MGMTLKVRGCSGGATPSTQTTCYQIDESFFIDAGAICTNLSIEDQTKIEHIVITHTHLDHVKDLGFIADNTIGLRKRPLTIYGSEETIQGLKKHFFNDIIWPDFSVIPTAERPVIRFQVLPLNGEDCIIGGYRVKAIPVNHIPGSTGYIISSRGVSLLFTGDTSETEAIWKVAQTIPDLQAIFTEISFPTSMEHIAHLSHHFCPKTFEAELKKIQCQGVPVYVAHFKPGLEDVLKLEIGERKLEAQNVRILNEGKEFKFEGKSIKLA